MAVERPINFQPLAREAQKRVESLGRYAEQLNVIMELSVDVAKAIGEQEGGDQNGEFKQLEEAVETFADLERKFAFQQNCMHQMHDFISTSDPEMVKSANFGELLKQYHSELDQNPDKEPDAQQNYQKRISDFEAVLKQLNPDVKDEDSDGDDELQLVQGKSKRELLCPLTGAQFVLPVKSKVCQHIYSKEAIENHIKHNGRSGSVPCPVAGCSKGVRLKDLARAVDVEFEQKRRKRGRKLEQGESDMDFTQQSFESQP